MVVKMENKIISVGNSIIDLKNELLPYLGKNIMGRDPISELTGLNYSLDDYFIDFKKNALIHIYHKQRIPVNDFKLLLIPIRPVDYEINTNTPVGSFKYFWDTTLNLEEKKSINELIEYVSDKILAELPYSLFQELLNKKFDVFGLIERGCAIDINSI
jgi:hypothetical protein